MVLLLFFAKITPAILEAGLILECSVLHHTEQVASLGIRGHPGAATRFHPHPELLIVIHPGHLWAQVTPFRSGQAICSGSSVLWESGESRRITGLCEP